MKKKASGGKGHTHKHAGTHKHHAHGAKHHPKQPLTHQVHGGGGSGPAVHTKAHHAKHPRGLAVGDLLPVCTFEAVAQSLRLLGQPVSDDEVAWLWEQAGSREVSIAEALDAAARFGLAGVRPVEAVALRGQLGVFLGEPLIDLPGSPFEAAPRPFGEFLVREHALILGVDVPGPHAVLATPDGWWSWGELWSPWTTAVSEAWAVAWS